MSKGELAPAAKWAARTLVVLAGACLVALFAWTSAGAWNVAGISLGIGSEQGRFVATDCATVPGVRTGDDTACTGRFTSDDERTVATGRLEANGTDSMAAGDRFKVRCDADGTCVFAGPTEAPAAVASALMVSAITVSLPLVTFIWARSVGRRRKHRGRRPEARRPVR
ncbi:hypothetical protein HHL19_10670 [Streptomyces sp. R302]|uniref:hypothetical protein n=1 Tax=unclassified Streptomyces TaxID=2593676 RepID=UPI00145E471B|nr:MULTISPECIES: hypothetical protein [unclassified Streptomyces]NML50126.1 hypothetical protein [Streptomyces sp. R301]NML79117.1 hypothetical protein [Streptomyces sp. R302]